MAGVSKLTFVMTCLMWLAGVAPSWAQQYSVLTIFAARRDAPGSVVADQVIQRVLSETFGGALDYYSEYIDVARFPDAEYQAALRDFLWHKYAGSRLHLVIAPTNTAIEFVNAHRDELFPGVPVVFSAGPGLPAGPNSTGVTHTLDMARTIAMAVRLQPHITRVYVVSGASAFDRYYEELARDQLRSWEERLTITYWSGLPMPDLLERVARLPSDAILYPLTIVEDGAGRRFHPLDSLDQVAAAASVPTYSFSDLAMNHGIVGGALNSTHVLATRVAELAVRVLRGERPDDIPVGTADILVEEVDWRQLQRWSISESRLPSGTMVRFRQPGLWERYRYYVLSAAVVVIIQTALIAGLLVQRRRARRVEGALRASYQHNRDLAGRLITAQEAERSRIARDLHDGVSQELAGMAISLSVLKGRFNGAADDPELVDSVTRLQQRTVSLAEDIRTLSHELHPGVLQHAGIVAALQSHCREFEQHHGIRARVDASPDLGGIEPDIALCLYRVAQEALTNTARHSGADAVDVALRRVDGRIQLVVSDNGAGFDSARQNGTGLGLRSIDERVRLTRGRLSLESQPGRGTQLVVSIPLPDAVRHQPVGPT